MSDIASGRSARREPYEKRCARRDTRPFLSASQTVSSSTRSALTLYALADSFGNFISIKYSDKISMIHYGEDIIPTPFCENIVVLEKCGNIMKIYINCLTKCTYCDTVLIQSIFFRAGCKSPPAVIL